jgi:hypothetical protein
MAAAFLHKVLLFLSHLPREEVLPVETLMWPERLINVGLSVQGDGIHKPAEDLSRSESTPQERRAGSYFPYMSNCLEVNGNLMT